MAKYTSDTSILATINGVEMTIPVDGGNRHYAELIASGVAIEPMYVKTAADLLAAWRTTARCSRMQGILALGATQWQTVLDYRATATWSEVIVIDDARDWYRNSETIALFGWLLNLTDTEIDALFVAAMQITA